MTAGFGPSVWIVSRPPRVEEILGHGPAFTILFLFSPKALFHHAESIAQLSSASGSSFVSLRNITRFSLVVSPGCDERVRSLPRCEMTPPPDGFGHFRNLRRFGL